MTVTMVTPTHRALALLVLVVAAVASVVRLITAVPALLGQAASVTVVLSWVYLVGLVVLIALWTAWTVRLARGTTARLEATGPGQVLLEQPWRTVHLEGCTPQGVSVHSFWRWHWVRLRGARTTISGREIPNSPGASVAVAGTRPDAEQVGDWLRGQLATPPGLG